MACMSGGGLATRLAGLPAYSGLGSGGMRDRVVMVNKHTGGLVDLGGPSSGGYRWGKIL